ncbi:hypothetical protein K0U83_16735 [bacterium]|jgi:hypothetical protein|nr:hypothetical protein [bacterium]
MPQYQGLPAIPSEEIPQWQYDILSSMKENLEIMMGQRGPGRTVTNDAIGVEAAERQTMKQLSARGDFYELTTTGGVIYFPTRDDYVKLLNDTQQLAIDVANIQSALNALLENLRS